MLVGRRPGLADPGALFRGNDSLLLESERALCRAAGDPNELTAYVTRFGHTIESADPIHPTLAEAPEVPSGPPPRPLRGDHRYCREGWLRPL